MKKMKVMFAVLFCILATSLFGACSCTGDTNISVIKISLDNNTKNVVEDSEFYIEYTLSPDKCTNKKMFVSITTGNSYLEIKNTADYIVDKTSVEKVYFKSKLVGDTMQTATVQFESADNNIKKTCTVNIYPAPEPLEAPVNIRYENNKIVWNTVTNSTGYIVNVNENEYTVTTAEYAGTGDQLPLVKGQEYSIKVKALGNVVAYGDSEYSSIYNTTLLTSPTNIVANNGVITWDAVENATHYIVSVNNTEYTVAEGTSYTLDTTSAVANYDIKIKAQNRTFNATNIVDPENDGEYKYIIDSTYTAVKKLTRLTAPTNLRLDSFDTEIDAQYNYTSMKTSILKWNTVAGVSGFEIKLTEIKEGGLTKTATVNALTTNCDLEKLFDTAEDNYTLTAGKYSVVVKAVGNAASTVYGDFSITNTYNFVQLPIVSGTCVGNNLSINTGELSTVVGLSATEIAKLNYELYFKNTTTNNVSKILYTGNSTVIALNEITQLNGGSYSLVIRPIAGNEMGFNASNAMKYSGAISTIVGGVVKLNGVQISAISNDYKVAFPTIDGNDNYHLTIKDNENDITSFNIPVTSALVNKGEEVTKIELLTQLSNLTAGNYTMQISVTSDTVIDSSVSHSNQFAFTKLSAVVGHSLTNNVVTWEHINGRYGYLVDFNGNIYNTQNDTSQIVDNTFKPNTSIFAQNSFAITVLGNNENIIASNAYSATLYKLTTVSNLNLDEGKLVWDEQTNNTFHIQLFVGSNLQNTITTTQNYYDSFDLSATTIVSIYRSQVGYFNSDNCSAVRLAQLSSIDKNSVVIRNNTSVLEWTTISDTEEYYVTLLDENGEVENHYITTTNYVDLGVIDAGQYNVNVRPMRNQVITTFDNSNTYYVNGKTSENVTVLKLPSPLLSVNNGLLNWQITGSDIPRGYQLKVGSNPEEILNINNTSGSYDFANVEANSYNVSVIALGQTSTNVINSDSKTIAITKIATVQPQVEDGVITWQTIANATDYRIYNDENQLIEANRYSLTYNEDKAIFVLKNMVAGAVNKIKVQAIVNNTYINASVSDSLTFIKLNNVEGFTKQDNNLVWTNVSNNNGYKISGSMSQTLTQNATSESLGDIEEAGVLTYRIKALGNSVNDLDNTGYLNGDDSECIIVKLNTPQNIAINGANLTWASYIRNDGNVEKDMPANLRLTIETFNGSEYESAFSSDIAITVRSFDLTSLSDISSPSYRIKLQYLGTSEVISSEEVYYSANGTDEGRVVTKVSAPQLYIENGLVYFNKITDADSIQLYVGESILNVNNYTLTLNEESNRYLLTLKNINANEEYTISARALPATNPSKVPSLIGNSLTVIKLQTPSISFDSSENIIWASVANAVSYVLNNIKDDSNVSLTSGDLSYALSNYIFTEGNYNFNLQAIGSTNSTGSSPFYLNSDLSNSIGVNTVGNVENLVLDNDVLTWDIVNGVKEFKVEINYLNEGHDAVYTTYVLTNSFNLKDMVNNISGINSNDNDANITVKVSPFSLTNSTYYLSSVIIPTELEVVKPKTLGTPKVLNGKFAWTVDLSDLTIEEKAEAIQFYVDYINDTSAELIDDTLYQKYYHYWNFKISINNIEQDMVPAEYELLGNSIVFIYNVDEIVTTAKEYVLKVKTLGNQTRAGIDSVLSSNYSATITATKMPVTTNTVTENGNITFTMCTTGNESQPYIKDYILFAIPNTNGEPITYNIDVDLFDVADGQCTIENVRSLFTGSDALQSNVQYTFKLCTAGTIDSGLTIAPYLLRSNYYNSVQITFLGNIDHFAYEIISNSEGGVLSWTPQANREHNIYILNKVKFDEYNIAEKLWTQDDATIVIKVDGTQTVLEFDKYVNILGNTAYACAIECLGDGINYITSEALSAVIYVTKLSSVNMLDSSWVNAGMFVWAPVEQAGTYRVEIVKTDVGVVEPAIVDTVVTTNAYYTLPTHYNTLDGTTYGIIITPLGAAVGATQYVAGTPVTTNNYTRLKTPTLRIVGTTVLWNTIENATAYEVVIDTNIAIAVGSNSYDCIDIEPGTHAIKVRAITSGNVCLEGLYSEGITVKKMFNPNLRADTGLLIWSRSATETLFPSNTKITYAPYDVIENQITGAVVEINQTFESEDNFKFALPTECPAGNYLVTVQFKMPNDPTDSSDYQFDSGISKIIINKLATPVIQDGVYTINPEDKECDFDNYIKWQVIDNAYSYNVEIYNMTDIKVGATYNNITSSSLFDTFEKDGINYYAFDIDTAIVVYNVTHFKIQVTAIGNTTVYNNSLEIQSLGYVNSNVATHEIETPSEPPVIDEVNSNYQAGIIRWENTTDADVEVKIMNVNYKKYDDTATSTDYINTINKDTDEFIRVNKSEGNVFYLPYIGTNYELQLRFITSTYTSNWSNTINTGVNIFHSGAGTQAEPYIIYSSLVGAEREAALAQQFMNIQYRPNHHIKLLQDINLINEEWTMLDTFNGSLNGNYKEVQNIKLKQTYSNEVHYAAMWKNIGSNGNIYNITLNYDTEVGVGVSLNNKVMYAGIAITNNGTLQDIIMKGSIQIQGKKIIEGGGFVHTNNGFMRNCNLGVGTLDDSLILTVTYNGTASNKNTAGGFAYSNSGIIDNCDNNYSAITVLSNSNQASGGFLGGLVAKNVVDGDATGIIANSAVGENTVLTANSIGGIAYENEGKILGCSNSCQMNISDKTQGNSNIIDGTFSGGVAGKNSGIIAYCYVILTNNKLSIDYQVNNTNYPNYFGGLVGYHYSTNDEFNLDSCYVIIDATTNSNFKYGVVAGFMGAGENGANSVSNIYYYSEQENASIVGTGSNPISVIQMTQLTDFADQITDPEDESNMVNEVEYYINQNCQNASFVYEYIDNNGDNVQAYHIFVYNLNFEDALTIPYYIEFNIIVG